MTSTTTALIMAIALPLFGFSQNENTIKLPQQVNPTEGEYPVIQEGNSLFTKESNNIQITHVSSNAVSSTVTVHTYKYSAQDDVNVEHLDSEPNESNSTGTQTIIEQISKVEGVTDCTFDRATQTFTIVSETQTDLTQVVNNINKK